MAEARSGERGYDPFLWVKWSLVVLALVVALSTLAYWALGRYYGRNWPPLDCLFMVVITLTTIGYGDWLELKGLMAAECFTMLLAVVGMGVPAFLIANVTALIVEGLFSDVFRRRRMEKQIARLHGHFIVCGLGNTGYHCAEELFRTQRPFVVVDRDRERLERATAELGGFPYVVGPAEEDAVLRKAGVERASGLAACLSNDRDNVYITLSARELNPRLRIVSKVVDTLAKPKMLTAGADAAVNTTAIGGLRIVSELVRPAVVTFLDGMMRGQAAFRFEEVTVAPGSPLAGRSLGEAELRRQGDLLVVAAREAGSGEFMYNPRADFPLRANCVLVLLGPAEDLARLRAQCTGTAAPGGAVPAAPGK